MVFLKTDYLCYMRHKHTLISILVTLSAAVSLSGKDYLLTSPDGRTSVKVIAGNNLEWQVSRDDVTVISPSEMSMELKDGTMFGIKPKILSARTGTSDSVFSTPFYRKAEIRDRYNYLNLSIQGKYGIEFRAYDSGVAYRFISSRKDSITVLRDNVSFNFEGERKAWIPYVNDTRAGERYCYSFESYYTESPISGMFRDSLTTVPLLVELESGKKAAIMDAGTEDYPGMFLKKGPGCGSSIAAEFAPCPSGTEIIGANIVPSGREGHIAVTDGTRSFPWRVLVISDRDVDLADNDLMQCLSPECRIGDTSWIKPGKASWDWWSEVHLTGVDFRAGMNTETFRHFVDFSAANKLEYVLIDAGWCAGKLTEVVPALNLKEIVDYGKSLDVGVIIWCLWTDALDQAQTAFPYFAEMGVKGFKIDFIDSDDQPTVRKMYEMAELAADNHLIVDFHGMKATGLQRTYPNVLNFEGVKGLENSRYVDVFDDVPADDIPRYDVTIPFTRMLTGPMDYTPGAMDNAISCAYRPVGTNPMSMGTRVHQMAMYTVFEAPLQMLADSPSKYVREQECTDFIAKVPTVFDRTRAIDGKVGEYAVIARQKDGVWYIGALNNWTARDITVDLDFLGEGLWNADIFSDGVNADRCGEDYRRSSDTVDSSGRINVHLAPGGGWTARISRNL